MYKSTIVSFEEMKRQSCGHTITQDDNVFFTELPAFSPDRVRLGWSNNIAMMSPCALAPHIPVYGDPFNIIPAHLGSEYLDSFIEITPVTLARQLNRDIQLLCCGPRELTHLFIKIHWPAAAPPIDRDKFHEICQRFKVLANARIEPSNNDPCGIDYLILPLTMLDYVCRIPEHLHNQELAQLQMIDHTWRQYAAAAPFYRDCITKMIQSDPNLNHIFCAEDEYVTHRGVKQIPGVDLHRAMWYHIGTLDRIQSIKYNYRHSATVSSYSA